MDSKIRKVGEITEDLEPLLFELVDHELQHGEILALVAAWLEIHAPHARERYTDGTVPVRYYGHKDHIKDIKYERAAKTRRKR